MAENFTIVQRDKVFHELFDKIMKENVDFFPHLFLVFILVKQFWNKRVPYQHREENYWYLVGRIFIGGTVLSLVPNVSFYKYLCITMWAG